MSCLLNWVSPQGRHGNHRGIHPNQASQLETLAISTTKWTQFTGNQTSAAHWTIHITMASWWPWRLTTLEWLLARLLCSLGYVWGYIKPAVEELTVHGRSIPVFKLIYKSLPCYSLCTAGQLLIKCACELEPLGSCHPNSKQPRFWTPSRQSFSSGVNWSALCSLAGRPDVHSPQVL